MTGSAKAEPLLPRIAAGDSRAVEEAIERYKGLLWWLARQMAGDEAEDAVQELFIELWKNAARFDASKASEPTFVAMLARRRLIDRQRRRRSRPTEEPIDSGLENILESYPGSVEASAEASLATRVIQQLQPKEREVVLLSVCYGLSHSEIAKHVDLPLGTVKTYIRRGLMRVRKMLSPQAASMSEVTA